MNRILKLKLPTVGAGVVATGSVPRFLAVDWQGLDLVAWVEAEAGDTVETMVYTAMTGEAPAEDSEYVGTAQALMTYGPYVVHVYRQVDR